MLGTSLALLGGTSEGSETFGSFAPYARYYFVNQGNVAVYGGLSATIGFGDEVIRFDNGLVNAVSPAAGVSLPISKSGLLTPELTYAIRDDLPNTMLLNFKLELLISPNNSVGGQAIGVIGKNSWMLGAGLGGFSVTGGGTKLFW